MLDVHDDLERLRARMDDLPRPVQVKLHGFRSWLFTADPTARRTLPCVFGRQADVVDGAAPDDAAGWRVGCIRSNDLYRVWCGHFDRAAASGRLLDVKRWDGDSVAVRADWPEQIAVVRHTAPFTGLTVFAESTRTAAYLLPDGEPLSVQHLEHLFKYTLRVRCWGDGGVEVHAATCVYRDRGVVMMGFRRSGKTTLVMHLLSRGGCLLGSDLGLLRAAADGIAIRAIPSVCRISSETVGDNAYLRKAMARAGHGDDYLEGPVFFDDKHELYPAALDSVFGRPVNLAGGRADLIVLPRFSPEHRRQRLTWLSTEDARALVRERLPHDRPLPDWLPFDEVLHRDRIEAPHIDALVRRLPPVAQLEFGREDTLDWAEIDRMVDGTAGPRKTDGAGSGVWAEGERA